MMKYMFLLVLFLTGCAGTAEPVSSKSEPVITASTHMKVVMGKTFPPDPIRNIMAVNADPLHNDTVVETFSVSNAGPGVADHGVYFTSTNAHPNEGFMTVQTAEYDAFKALLNTPGRELQIDFMYDNTMGGPHHDITPETEDIVGIPVFSLVGQNPVTVSMNVRPNTHVAATDTQGPLQMDPASPNSAFTSVWVTKNATIVPPASTPVEGRDTFTPTTQFANLILSQAMWTSMSTRLNNPANQNSRVTITYENSGTSVDKQLLGLPVFTFIGESVTRQLYVVAGTTVTATQTAVDLNHDISHVSSCLDAHIVNHGTEGVDSFKLDTEHGSLFLSTALWADLRTKLNTPGHQVLMTFTYDTVSGGLNMVKPLVGPPTFTLL